MKKIYEVIGLFVILICSVIYDYQKGIILDNHNQQALSYVHLEGAFLYSGKYEFTSPLTINELIENVGIKDNACLESLSLNELVVDESSMYLPIYRDNMISLNKASKEELMTLERVGEKTAQKIIDYRNKQDFVYIEDIMNISGIGEKTFEKIRDYLCL